MAPNWDSAGKSAAISFNLMGIPVRVHTAFLILALFIGATGGTAAAIAGGVAILFLAILGHELGHAAAGQALGVEPTIELHGLGGHTSFTGGPIEGRLRRLALAVAGPVAGVLVGATGWWAGRDLVGTAGYVADLAWWVGGVWGLANLLPVLPLDGGHVLVELLPGDPARRLRRARFVSTIVGVALAALAWNANYVVGAALVAWFTAMNVMELTPSRSGSRSRESTARQQTTLLNTAFEKLHPQTAGEVEAMAWKVLEGATEKQRFHTVLVLACAQIMQGRHAEAHHLLSALEPADAHSGLRDLAALGPDGGAELDRRMAATPTVSDIHLAFMNAALRQQWTSAVAIATFDELGRLAPGWIRTAASWAFHAGEFEASAHLGQVLEGRENESMTPYNVACAWARYGDDDAAVAALQRAAELGWEDLSSLDRDDDLASLRTHPGLAAVRARVAHNGRFVGAGRSRWPVGGVAALAGCAVATALVVGSLPQTGGFR